MTKLKKLWKEYWLMGLIILQPVLDIMAFWMRDSVNTPAGYIRLAILVIMPLYLLITLREKKPFFIFLVAVGTYCALHVFNCFRVGYMDIRFDITYLTKIIQMPVMAVCFMYFIKDEKTKEKVIRGILIAAGITIASIIIGVITGTAKDTYGKGFGISGWVIEDNRCANSVILVTFAVFMIFAACRSENRWVNYLLPAVAVLVLIVNGTKACYYSVFALTVGFAVMLVIEKFARNTKLKKRMVAWLLIIAVASAIAYPITPRYRIDADQAKGRVKVQNKIEEILTSLGYDLSSMTMEEKRANPVIVTVFGDYYYDVIWHIIPDMFARFDYDAILTKYRFSTDAETITDVRLMKKNYASLVSDTKDALTRAVGYEPTDVMFNSGIDVENDWPAIYFYFGWLGLGLYALFVLYILWLVLRRCMKDLRSALTLENFALLVCFVLHIGLAQFSGSVLRRPNVSIYTALCAALLYYKTVVVPVEGHEE